MASCRVCGSESILSPIGRESNGYPLFRCSSCGTILTVTAGPSPAKLYDGLFEDGEYAEHRAQFENLVAGKHAWGLYHAWMIRRIERRTSVGRLVEIGGGTGAFGLLASRRGWKYTDYDVSATAVAFAGKLGLDARSFGSTTPPPLESRSADVVVMWEVIEHVWDVSGYLRVISTALRKGGLLVMSTPNWDYMGRLELWGPLSSPPIHCNFFEKASLRTVLERHGFGPVVVEKKMQRPGGSARQAVVAARQLFGLEPTETLAVFAEWSGSGVPAGTGGPG